MNSADPTLLQWTGESRGTLSGALVATHLGVGDFSVRSQFTLRDL